MGITCSVGWRGFAVTLANEIRHVRAWSAARREWRAPVTAVNLSLSSSPRSVPNRLARNDPQVVQMWIDALGSAPRGRESTMRAAIGESDRALGCKATEVTQPLGGAVFKHRILRLVDRNVSLSAGLISATGDFMCLHLLELKF